MYRIKSLHGTLTTSFVARADPACLPLGACGASGGLSDVLAAGRGSLTIEASRIVRRRVGAGAALRDLRAGRLAAVALPDLAIRGDLSATAAQSGEPTCHDMLQQAGLSLGAMRSRGAIDLSVGDSASSGGSASPAMLGDPMRTRCPGPSSADLLGGEGPLGSGELPLRDLGDRGPRRVALVGKGVFSSASYAGARGGAVVIELALVRVRAGTMRVKRFVGGG